MLFFAAIRRSGRKVLVHSLRGQGRAAVAVIQVAYLATMSDTYTPIIALISVFVVSDADSSLTNAIGVPRDKAGPSAEDQSGIPRDVGVSGKRTQNGREASPIRAIESSGSTSYPRVNFV